MSVCITINDAVKKYGDNTIISDLSLKVRKGVFHSSGSFRLWKDHAAAHDCRIQLH